MHLTRRTLLGAGATGAAAVMISAGRKAAAQVDGGTRAPIVLLHGAWHGGWCWKRVASRLRAAGHEVFTPTLTGLGERVHLAAPDIDLDTHITDVLNVLTFEELSNVVLVGHSYAGMVVTGVADRADGRVRSLVYLDAFVPGDGRSLIDYVTAADRRDGRIKAEQAGGYLHPMSVEALGITDAQDQAWVRRRVTPHPYATFSQPLRFMRDGGARLPRTYVYCSNPPAGAFEQFAKRYRNDPAWRFHELKTGHDCMVTRPEDVAGIVLEAASAQRATATSPASAR